MIGLGPQDFLHFFCFFFKKAKTTSCETYMQESFLNSVVLSSILIFPFYLLLMDVLKKSFVSLIVSVNEGIYPFFIIIQVFLKLIQYLPTIFGLGFRYYVNADSYAIFVFYLTSYCVIDSLIFKVFSCMKILPFEFQV